MSVFAQAQTNVISRIRVDGNKFVTPDGTPIVFRGLDTSDPDKLNRDGHWNKAYFEEMKRWGANIVRFPVHPTAWRLNGEDKYIKLLDQGITWANELSMYVIIDWHSIGNLLTEMSAGQYKDNTTVAFFELFNEPTIMKGQLGQCSLQQWKVFVEEMIGIIRANGSTAIPLVAGFN